MDSSVGGCGGGEVEGVRSGIFIIISNYERFHSAYLLREQLASWDLLQRES